MAPPRWRESPSVIRQLLTTAWRFQFFQAVRLLEGWHGQHRVSDGHGDSVGYDSRPSSEAVRFRVLPHLIFPGAEIHNPPGLEGQGDQPTGEPIPLAVSFLGIIGPLGALPNHYTSLALARVLQKDTAMTRFLDLFHHRTISFFYRAWEKYRFALGYERHAATRSREPDPFTQVLYSLVGLGTRGLRGRLRIADETVLYYAGLFVQYPRNASNLERLLSDYLGIDAAVEQFQGRWLYLDRSDFTRMPTRRQPMGRQCELGVSFVAGERVWDVQSRFRIRIGPLDLARFQTFLPGREGLLELCQLARLYVGPGFDFDVQPILRKEDVPGFALSSRGDGATALGWTSWSLSTDARHDRGDVVFSLDDA